MRRAAALLCALLWCAVLFAACEKSPSSAASTESGGTRNETQPQAEAQLQPPAEGAMIATLTTSLGDISFVLYPDAAPMAVENFTGLAAQGYYNGLPFHRVVADYLIQTGDATGTGTGGSTIWGGTPYPVELSDSLHHFTGAVAMACVQDEGNRSQFYIVAVPQDSVTKKAAQALTEAGVRQSVADGYTAVGGAPELDNLDTVFGQVYAGMDVVDAIAASKEAVTVESVTVGTYAAPPVQGDWEEVPTRGRRPLDSRQRGAAPLESNPGRGILGQDIFF